MHSRQSEKSSFRAYFGGDLERGAVTLVIVLRAATKNVVKFIEERKCTPKILATPMCPLVTEDC